VLLRLAYLALTNMLTLMRLLPMGDQEKDIEILALRHQLIVLQRQVGKPAFTQTDRMVLAGLLHFLPAEKLRQLLLLVRPGTLLRWHRVWVPNTVSPHATWAYSWMRPPSLSRRRTRVFVTAVGGCARPAGGFWCGVRCGRWPW